MLNSQPWQQLSLHRLHLLRSGQKLKELGFTEAELESLHGDQIKEADSIFTPFKALASSGLCLKRNQLEKRPDVYVPLLQRPVERTLDERVENLKGRKKQRREQRLRGRPAT